MFGENILLFRFLKFSVLTVCFLLFLDSSFVYAQNQVRGDSDVRVLDVRVLGLTRLASENHEVILWGVERIELNAPVFMLKARGALERHIASSSVQCRERGRDGAAVIMQCDNHAGEDLSLFLLQQGYVSVDRRAVRGALSEKLYLHAETLAQSEDKGFWAQQGSMPSREAEAQSKNFVMGSFFLMAVFVLAVGFLSVYIMRGFRRVVDLQNQSLDLAAKERTLKEQDKHIIASLIHSEIRENKPKIEAYLMIYEEMLRDFDDSSKTPKCMQTGEVIQKQPALSRSVFDGNTGKLELFGEHMASDVIHYYARIKTEPGYVEIKTDMQVEDARGVVARCVDAAKKLEVISDHLIQKFDGKVVAHS